MVPICIFVLLLLAILARRVVLPPANFPRNIPTIPFYVCFVPILTRMDQRQIYYRYFRDKLEQHGAVKVYFGSQWNILVTRPEYVAQIFKQNDVFEKSGNNAKIPHAVVLEYLGDNVISANNRNWKLYRLVVTDSILFPDLAPIAGHVSELVSALKGAAGNGPVPVTDMIQRFSLACIGDCVIGCNLDRKIDVISVHDRVKYLKSQIFRPLYMNFPDLDRLPIPSRQKARKAIGTFKKLLCAVISASATGENTLRLGPRLAASYSSGDITRRQFEDNAIIALIAGHENPQILLTNILYCLAKHRAIQQELRQSLQDAQSVLLDCVIYETLRLFPPLGQLINRKTTRGVNLGPIFIPKHTYVGINSLFAQRSLAWENADRFCPRRWGTTREEVQRNYTLAKSRCRLTAFHGRARACLGEKFALVQIRQAVARIVEEFEIGLDPAWHDKLTPMGPVWPVQLSLVLTCPQAETGACFGGNSTAIVCGKRTEEAN